MALPGARTSPRDDRPAAETLSGTLIGFDFGTRRLGVAVGETATGIAHALLTIEGEALAPRLAAIERLVAEWRPAAFVIGRPRHADGAPHPVARAAEKFARRLAARYSLPVVFVDETLSSAAASAQLRELGRRESARGEVDALAAAVILQSYLDSPWSHERLAS